MPGCHKKDKVSLNISPRQRQSPWIPQTEPLESEVPDTIICFIQEKVKMNLIADVILNQYSNEEALIMYI